MNTPFDPTNNRVLPLPEDLTKSVEGKDSGTASTLLSTHRTQLSEHRTSLSERRTGLSDLRSHLSNERTHLSYLRTAISLIGFGITINRFSLYLHEKGKLDATQNTVEGLRSLRTSEYSGAGMVFIGLALTVWALYRYWHVNQDIETARFRPLNRAVVMLTMLLVIAGGFTAVWLFFLF